MDTLAFDGRMGASGDMILAALIAAGADPGVLDRVEDRLDLRYVLGKTEKNGIAATTVNVLLDGDGEGRADVDRPDGTADAD
ncbi:nickel insertion protein, partial [Halobium palmae]